MKIAFSSPVLPESGTVVVSVLEERSLTATGLELDRLTGGALTKAMENSRFKGKKRETLLLLAPSGVSVSRILLAGLGKAAEIDETLALELGGEILASLNSSGETAITVALDLPEGTKCDEAGFAAAIGYGAMLRSYRFARYKTKEKEEQKPSVTDYTILTSDCSAAETGFTRLQAVAEGVFEARNLANEPANIVYPESLAAQAAKLAELGVDVEILGEKEMAELGMGALLGVGQGSVRESKLVVMQWKGDPDNSDGPLAFLGKGVTFDTGGISIKPSAGMEDMKWDMGGSAVVVGLMKALAGRKAKANVIGVIGCVENMPSGSAQRPGDIVTSMSGQTIEVLNTDAEGRLVLADALWYTQDRFKPRFMIDLATLTGAIIISLGAEYAGLFANDDDLAEKLTAAGKAVNEPVWRLPMGDAYDKELDADQADMKNIGAGRGGGSITAACFLQRFVNKVPWAHLDIAGVTWAKKDKPVTPKGATGFGVRLLDQFVADNYES